MVLQRVRKQKPTYSLYVPPIVSPQRAVGHFYSWCRAVISHVSVSHSHMCFLEGKFLLKCGQSGGLARIIAANFPLKFWIWSKYEEKSHSWPFELCKKKRVFGSAFGCNNHLLTKINIYVYTPYICERIMTCPEMMCLVDHGPECDSVFAYSSSHRYSDDTSSSRGKARAPPHTLNVHFASPQILLAFSPFWRR
jgi:hypothetical protein